MIYKLPAMRLIHSRQPMNFLKGLGFPHAQLERQLSFLVGNQSGKPPVLRIILRNLLKPQMLGYPVCHLLRELSYRLAKRSVILYTVRSHVAGNLVIIYHTVLLSSCNYMIEYSTLGGSQHSLFKVVCAAEYLVLVWINSLCLGSLDDIG